MSISEKFKAKQELPEVKKKPNNPNRLFMSRDEVIDENRRLKEKEARLKIATEQIERELEQEDMVVKAKKPKKQKVAEMNIETNEEM